eukprot:14154923-Alexandrium_andersonii.AAC.1
MPDIPKGGVPAGAAADQAESTGGHREDNGQNRSAPGSAWFASAPMRRQGDVARGGEGRGAAVDGGRGVPASPRAALEAAQPNSPSVE